MDPVDNVDVAPSADQGNVPLDAPSLPETPTPEVPPETPKEPETPAAPVEPTLYELPDGRKVDAETLASEFKENFLPEFTRKSQELAELKKAPQANDINNPTPKNPYSDPNYVPQSYDELIEEGKRRALAEWEGREKAQVEKQQAIEAKVVNELDQIKKLDPNVNTEALFAHAMKYNFDDLTLAHKNMKDMQAAIKSAQTETVKNITKRNDPIATKPGGTGTPMNPRSFSSAVDYLRAIGGQK